MGSLKYQSEYKRYLPHIQPPGATLFLTFRLVGPIPRHLHEQLLAEQEEAAKRMSNHGHAVFTPLESEPGLYFALSTIMHSIK